MLKALLALIFLLTVTPADAAPVVGAVVGFGIKLLGFAGGLLFKAVLAVGSSLLQQYLSKKASKKSSVAGVTLELKMGDDLPMSFPVGERAVAGRRKYAGTYGQDNGTPNAFVVDVIELSCLPSRAGPQGIKSIAIDDKLNCKILWNEPDQYGRGYPVEEFRKDGKDHLWIWYLDGTQTTANPYLRDKFGSHPERPWTDSMIGRGCQAIIITARFNADLFGGSLPSVLVEPMPTPFYDARYDSTNGGSGPQRFHDATTWQPTVNNAVIIGHIVRGIYYGDEWVYGGQNVAQHRLPASSMIAAANECDRLVAGANGDEPQFRCGYEIYVDVEALEVINELRLGCVGRLAEVGGIIKLQVGAPGSAVYFFDDDTLVVSRDQDFEPFPSISDTFNGFLATYPERAERWQMKDAPGRRDLALEAEDDGNTLPMTLAFEAVPFSGQVQRLSKTLLEENRRFRSHVVPLPPSAWVLEPNDVVSWTLSTRNGYQNKKFIITRIVGGKGMVQQVSLRELEPSDYTPPSVILPPTTGWIGPITVPEQPMYGWGVEPATIKDEQGRPRRPSVRISCDRDQDDVTHVHVQIRIRDTNDVIFDSDSTPYGEPYSWIVQKDLPNNTWLECRGKFVPGTQRDTAWSEWLPVKTDDIRLSGDDLWADLESVRGALKVVLENVTRLYDQHDDLVEQLAAATAVGAGQIFNTTSAVVKTTDALAASYIQQSAKIEELNGQLVATAELIAGVKAQVSDVSADGLLSFKANTNPGNGALSEITMSARAAAGGQTARASHIIRVYMQNGQLVSEQIFTANRCIFVSEDGTVVGTPIIIENGMLTLDVGRIKTAVVGELKAANGKWSLRGLNDYADWRWWS